VSVASLDTIIFDLTSAEPPTVHRLEALTLAGRRSRTLVSTGYAGKFWPTFNGRFGRVIATRAEYDRASQAVSSRLMLLGLNGEPEARLDSAPHDLHGQHAAVSHDGRRLAIEVSQRHDINPDVWILSELQPVSPEVFRGRWTRILANPLGIGMHHPLFLPDGERVVYLRNYQYEDGLEVCLTDLRLPPSGEENRIGALGGAHVRRLTHEADVVWKRRGALALDVRAEVAFFIRGHYRHAHQQVCAIDCSVVAEQDPRAVRSVSELFSGIDSLVVAPTGGRIAFIGDGQVQLAAPDGGELLQIDDIGEGCVALAFSPDGRWLAYARRVGRGSEIWVVDANGGQARERIFAAADGHVAELIWI
jgi:hypothetical protein